jgi:glucokinase
LAEEGYETSEIEAVGLSSPGEVFQETGKAYFPIDGIVSPDTFQRFGDLYVVNDASLGAIGEYVYGNHRTENLIYITISTGIGAGYILDGVLVEGLNGNAGQVGHIKLSDCTVPCQWCDGTGHWMACSGQQLPQLARAIANLEISDAKELFARYESGDPAAKKVINKMNSYNAEAITQLVNVLNPEVIVIGGSVALNNPDTVIKGIEANLGPGCMNEVPRVAVSQLGDDIILMGLKAVCTGEFDYSLF